MPIEVKGEVIVTNKVIKKTGPEEILHERRVPVRKAIKASIDDDRVFLVRGGKIKEIGKKSRYLLDQLELED